MICGLLFFCSVENDATLTVGTPSSSCCAGCGAVQGHRAESSGSAASDRSASPGCLHTRCGTVWSPWPIQPPCSSGSCSYNTEQTLRWAWLRTIRHVMLPLTTSWDIDISTDVYRPECVGAESCLIITSKSGRSLVSWHHVLQRGLLDHIKTDTQTSTTLHVIDMLWLEDGVHRQTL